MPDQIPLFRAGFRACPDIFIRKIPRNVKSRPGRQKVRNIMPKYPEPKEKYDYRPAVHFTAPENWINDPNGMVYINGEYHLFYQHYPLAPHWGPMHWGHAVSRDLLHWEHLPVALYPDELGCIFSGSCVYDINNVSGFGTEKKPPLVAVFTHHSMDGKHTEHQSIAYSTDLRHFEKYYGNPVIPNPGQKDFRDPKVFWNPVRKCYSLVLAAGDHVEFHASEDLKHWEKTGEFKAGVHGLSGTCECPDCFPLMTEEGEKWILIISMILPHELIGVRGDVCDRMSHITQYYIGDFDGDTFHDTECAGHPLLTDYGTDNYAAVTFQNLEERVMMGWADNWDYANFAPGDGNGFRGKMTLARRMRLVRTRQGLRLAFTNEGPEHQRLQAVPLSPGENRLRSQTVGLTVSVNGTGSVSFRNQTGEELTVSVNEQEIIVDRTRAGQTDFCEAFTRPGYSCSHAPRLAEGSCEMEIVLDKCILEVLADNGLVPVTTSIYPTRPYETVHIAGDLKAELFPIT